VPAIDRVKWHFVRKDMKAPPPSLYVRLARRVPARYRKRLRRALGPLRR
jgi:hypothetical protein